MKIYTKGGDDGTTGLLGGRRVPKDHARIEAVGAVDELNAALGVARATGLHHDDDERLRHTQNELFAVGSALADTNPEGRLHGLITTEHVERIEAWIDALDAALPPLVQFILPGGSPVAAQLHLARTICRRAERRVVHLAHEHGESVADALVVYLNRLGDLLFVLARDANRRHGVHDIPWSGV